MDSIMKIETLIGVMEIEKDIDKLRIMIGIKKVKNEDIRRENTITNITIIKEMIKRSVEIEITERIEKEKKVRTVKVSGVENKKMKIIKIDISSLI